MTAASRPRRPLRTLLGMVLLLAAACLFTWFAFSVSRGPSECGGGGAPACSGGFVAALAGFFVSLFVLAPVGFALTAARVPGVVPATLTLTFGGAAAAVYVGRFVTAPVTDATVGPWIATIVLGLIAVPNALVTVASLLPRRAAAGAASRSPDRARPAGAGRAAGAGAAADAGRAAGTGTAGDAGRAAGAGATRDAGRAAGAGAAPDAGPATGAARTSGTGRPANAGRSAADGGTGDSAVRYGLRDLLVHGLATGDLATGDGRTPQGDDARVRHLVDLHRRGILDDDALRDALTALRSPRDPTE